MKDNRSKMLEDEFGNAALNLMLDKYAGESGAQLLEEYERASQTGGFAAELDRVCERQIRRVFQRRRFQELLLRFAKTAAVSIACLCLCLTMILSVDALRVPFLNFFLVRGQKYTQVGMQSEKASQSADLFAELEAASRDFAPDGYALTRAESTAASFSALYENEAGDIASISVYDGHGVLNVDSEDCTETRLTVNGLEAVHWKKRTTPAQSVLLLDPEREVCCHLYAANMPEADFWRFVYTFAAALS